MANIPEEGKEEILRKQLADTDPQEIPNDKLADAIKFEVDEWDKKRLNIQQMVNFNIFNLDSIVGSIIDVLLESGLITEEDFGPKVQRKILSNLRMHRSGLEVAVLQSTILQGINNPQIMDKYGRPMRGFPDA
jgi:hypothetical protein